MQVCRLPPPKYFCTLQLTKTLHYTTLPWSMQPCANTTRYSDLHFSREHCRPATNTSAPYFPWSAAPRFTIYTVVLNSVYWNFIHWTIYIFHPTLNCTALLFNTLPWWHQPFLKNVSTTREIGVFSRYQHWSPSIVLLHKDRIHSPKNCDNFRYVAQLPWLSWTYMDVPDWLYLTSPLIQVKRIILWDSFSMKRKQWVVFLFPSSSCVWPNI